MIVISISGIKPSFSRALKVILRLLAAHSSSRRTLNALYLRLTYPQRKYFYHHFAKIFRGAHFRGGDGIWNVEFAGQRVQLPLTRERMWLDWDLAVSIVGHEVGVTETYSSLIASPKPPELFVDVGANYGIHSLLFLVHSIDTITFEPNSSCHEYFREICALNNVKPRLEAVALGKDDGYVDLFYPERDTWIGSTDKDIVTELVANHQLITERVKQSKLDDYFPGLETRRILIKIDTEGNEYNVLNGALRILQEKRPLVIFECLGGARRARLFDFFEAQEYRLAHLPNEPNRSTKSMERLEFVGSPALNFLAVPAEELGLWSSILRKQ